MDIQVGWHSVLTPFELSMNSRALGFPVEKRPVESDPRVETGCGVVAASGADEIVPQPELQQAYGPPASHNSHSTFQDINVQPYMHVQLYMH